MLRKARYGVLMLALSRLGVSQTIDWAAFFRTALSTDRKVQDAARERALGETIPALCHEDGKLAAAEIPGLLNQFEQGNDAVRTQASAVLFVMARFRSDGAAVLTTAVPVLIRHSSDSVEQIRENSVNALAELKPEAPAAALPVFLAVLNTPDSGATAGAVFGLARMAARSTVAVDALDGALTQKVSPQRVAMAIRAMTGADVTEPRLLRRFGESLSNKDRAVERAALRAMASLGGAAIALNRESIARFVSTCADAELLALAQQLLAQPAT